MGPVSFAAMVDMVIQPATLNGKHVRLIPLQLEHAAMLVAHSNDEEIWRFMPFGFVNTVERMEGLISDLLQRRARGTDLPFAIALQTADDAPAQLIGMTRFMSIERHHRGLEVGGSWLGSAFRRTACNTEAKYLLFRYAFETLGCVRLQLKTDVRNERSQRAIERIGAVREGILRNNMILQDGYIRSSVYYSIIDSEWPAVRARLEAMLAAS